MKARDNPFASVHVESLAFRLRGISWAGLMRRLKEMNYRAAVVGPHGSGKTTLLEALEPALVGRGFTLRKLRLSEEHPSFDRAYLRAFLRGLGPADLVLFDGAEQMSRLAWGGFEKACRTAGGLLITTHLPGRMPLLYRCGTDAALLMDLLGELLGKPVGNDLREEADYLLGMHEGNIREVCRDLYDRFAGD